MKIKIVDIVWLLIIIWLLTIKQIMPKIFIIFSLLLLIVSSNLKSESMKNEYFIFAENKLPESKLLIDRQLEKIDKKIHKKKKNEYNLEKIKREKVKNIKKLEFKKNYKFTINFMPEEEKPNEKEIKIFYDHLTNFDRRDSITLKGYAQKRENDSTSKVRRLSLKRALFLRSLLLKENYDISKIYIKALGYNNELKGNKDIVVITNN